MGKRRRRSSRSSRDSIWTQEYGGMPVWGLGLASVALLAIGAIAVPAALTQPAVDLTRAPRPIPTLHVESERPVVAVVGDSYTGGSAMGGTEDESWARKFLKGERWSVTPVTKGGAGFVKPSPDGIRFLDRIGDVAATDADVVLIAGGHNDNDQDPAEVEAAALEFIEAVQARLPDARIVVAGPIEQRDPTDPYLQTRDAIFAAAASAGVTDLIDPLAEGWFNGARGVGGADTLIGEDGVHPTDEGHDWMAEKMRAALDRLGVIA